MAGGGFLWLRGSLPNDAEMWTVDGLSDRVTVLFDAAGVPHIYATSEADGAFALGFLHARDRLWQMEATRRAGAGRMGEVVGAAAVPFDRWARTMGLYRLAERQAADLGDDARRLLAAYAAGVNARLDNRRGPLPPEFILLRHEPEAWRPADSVVWAKLMAVRLSWDRRREALRARIAARLGDQRAAELWPPYPDGGAVTVAEHVEGVDDRLLAAVSVGDPAPSPGLRGASNMWAVAGDGTASGKPLLANDPHLGLNAPGVWYLARIVTPQREVVGATAPGIPFVVIGHNDRAAWGITNTGSDLEDLFVERLDPEDPDRYLTPDGSRPFEVRRETIRVRDEPPVDITIRSTRHGPVLSDLGGPESQLDTGSGTVLALAATYLQPGDRTAEALRRLNRIGDRQDFIDALRHFHAPQQNIGYADASGAIGFVAAGRVPVRAGPRFGGPAPGWSGAADWTGFVPFESLPAVFDPAAGKIVNANNKVVPPDYPWDLGDNWDDPYRAERIVELLAERPVSADAVAAMQRDARSRMAVDLLPVMLDGLGPTKAPAGLVEALRTWDGTMDRNRPEPLAFIAWLAATNRHLYEDELGPLFEEFRGLRPRLMKSVLVANPLWCNDVTTDDRTESCGEQLAAALEAAVETLTEAHGEDWRDWRWGDGHRATFRHRLFDRVGPLRWFGNRRIDTDGGGYTVNRGGHRVGAGNGAFAHVHGAGLRAVFDLDDLSRSKFMIAIGQSGNPLSRSKFMIAIGQSGNPLSRHYDDLMRPWRDGRMIMLGTSRDDMERDATARLDLRPRDGRQ